LGPDQREGAECFLPFLLRKLLFWFSERAKSRRMQKGSLPPIHPRISPKIPNPTHRFCYRTQNITRLCFSAEGLSAEQDWMIYYGLCWREAKEAGKSRRTGRAHPPANDTVPLQGDERRWECDLSL